MIKYSEIINNHNIELTTDGIFTIDGKEFSWYKAEKTNKSWIPTKRRYFVSLVKQCFREGDFDDVL